MSYEMARVDRDLYVLRESKVRLCKRSRMSERGCAKKSETKGYYETRELYTRYSNYDSGSQFIHYSDKTHVRLYPYHYIQNTVSRFFC